MYICTMDEVAAMKRCIALARNSIGYHHPNPKVGCIIVHNNKSKKRFKDNSRFKKNSHRGKNRAF